MRSSAPSRLLYIGQQSLLYELYGGNPPPRRCSVNSDGMWTLAEASDYLAEGRWPTSYFTVNDLNDVELKCVDSVVLNASLTYDCPTDLFNYTPLYFWEVSYDNAATWQPVLTSAYNLSSKKLVIGNSEAADGTVDKAYQLYGYVDSVRVTVGVPRYTTPVISPYNPALPRATLADNYTKLGINLGDPGSRTVMSPVVDVWTPTIGNASGSQNIRITTIPGVNTGWDGLFPLRQSANFFGYSGTAPAVQFVTSALNYVGLPSTGGVAGGLGTHYNYLRITDSGLTVPYNFAANRDDCCYEGYVRIRRFLHSYDNSAGAESVFIDTRTNRSTTDGVCIYFTPQSTLDQLYTSGVVNVKIPFTSRVMRYGPISSNTYHHIAVSKQFNTWRLYVNGLLRDSFTSQGPSLTLTGLKTTDSGTKYRVRVQRGALREQYSNTVNIAVLSANFVWSELGKIDDNPGIQNIDITDPLAHKYTVTPGVFYTFSATAYINNFAGGVFTYQWQSNPDPINTPEDWRDIAGPGAGSISNSQGGSVSAMTLTTLIVAQITTTPGTPDIQGYRVRVRCNDIVSSSRTIITEVGGTTNSSG